VLGRDRRSEGATGGEQKGGTYVVGVVQMQVPDIYAGVDTLAWCDNLEAAFPRLAPRSFCLPAQPEAYVMASGAQALGKVRDMAPDTAQAGSSHDDRNAHRHPLVGGDGRRIRYFKLH
jgi:hypothetical protein